MAAIFGLNCQTNNTVTLLQDLGGANNSVLFSPFYLTLSMITAYAFAKGATFMEVLSLMLCIPDDQKFSSYNSNQGTFVNSFANVEKKYISSDFEFFAQLGLPLSYNLSQVLKEGGTKLHRLDFKSPKSVESINKMIAKITNQSITQIVSTLNPDTASVNVGEITVEGTWKVKFNEPKNGTFYVNATTKKTIPMLQQTSGEFGYLETEQFRALRLPLVVNSTLAKNCTMDTNRTKRKHKCPKNAALPNLHLLVFLPQKRFGLPKALEHLQGSTIRKLMETKNSKIDLTLPSFDLEHATTFDHQLEQFGVKKILDPKEADIPDMFSKGVYSGGFTQKIHFKINSTGSEMVLGIADQMILQKRSKRSAYKKIKVDEPFVYMVCANSANDYALLYAGIFH
ncbi:Serpin family protein [Aphelenchoides besseyi]|nr:Serpin family protein [Aphelenchoides besseyi]